jgi:hypothetical protein
MVKLASRWRPILLEMILAACAVLFVLAAGAHLMVAALPG